MEGREAEKEKESDDGGDSRKCQFFSTKVLWRICKVSESFSAVSSLQGAKGAS